MAGEPPTRDRPIARARADFLEWLAGGGAAGRSFLQARIRPTGGERFEIRHVSDANTPDDLLERYDDPAAALRISRVTSDGGYRPLRTAPDLRSGWVLAGLGPADLWQALSHLYPAAALHWHLERTGELVVTPFEITAGRQTGIYQPVQEIRGPDLARLVEACCAPAMCLRRLRWTDEMVAPENAGRRVTGGAAAADEPASEAVVPCPEACSLFISFAREALPLTARVARFDLHAERLTELARLLERAATLVATRFSVGVPTGDPALYLNPRRLRLLAQHLRIGEVALVGDDGEEESSRGTSPDTVTTVGFRWSVERLRSSGPAEAGEAGEAASREGPGEAASREGPGEVASREGAGEAASREGAGEAASREGAGEAASREGAGEAASRAGAGEAAAVELVIAATASALLALAHDAADRGLPPWPITASLIVDAEVSGEVAAASLDLASPGGPTSPEYRLLLDSTLLAWSDTLKGLLPGAQLTSSPPKRDAAGRASIPEAARGN